MCEFGGGGRVARDPGINAVTYKRTHTMESRSRNCSCSLPIQSVVDAAVTCICNICSHAIATVAGTLLLLG